MSLSLLSEQFGNALILLFLVGIPLYGYCKKVPVYDWTLAFFPSLSS